MNYTKVHDYDYGYDYGLLLETFVPLCPTVSKINFDKSLTSYQPMHVNANLLHPPYNETE